MRERLVEMVARRIEEGRDDEMDHRARRVRCSAAMLEENGRITRTRCGRPDAVANMKEFRDHYNAPTP